MKQTIKVIIFSCFIGATLAGIFFLSIKEKAEAKVTPIVYAFQVGVFKNISNAEKEKNEYSFAKIVKDGDLYRVFIGVTVKNKDILKEKFDKQNINYYIKEISVADVTFNNILKYDEILLRASLENNLPILKQMLEVMPDEL